MVYQKTNWTNGMVITSDGLNNLEDGVSSIDDELNQVLPSIKGVATPYQYGAVGDGVADDTSAIQNMLNDWHNKDIVMNGDFLISTPLQVNNTTSIRLTGRIIASNQIDYIFNATTTFGIDGGGIGTIDCNYKSGGISLSNEALFSPINLIISNIQAYKIGIFTGKKSNGDTDGFVHANNLSISNRQEQFGTIGIYSGRDSFYNNIETINIQTAIQIYGVDVFISGLHPWNDIPSIVKVGGGVHLESGANSIYVNNYYNDSMKFAFYLDEDNEITISNVLTMWNTNVYNDANNSGNPYFIYYSNNSLTGVGKNVTVSNSLMNQKPGSSNSMTPYFSNISDNYVSVLAAGYNNSSWLNQSKYILKK